MTGFFKRLFFGRRRGRVVIPAEALEASPRPSWLVVLLGEVRVLLVEKRGYVVHLVCRSRHFDRVAPDEPTPLYLPSIESTSNFTDGNQTKVSFRRKE